MLNWKLPQDLRPDVNLTFQVVDLIILRLRERYDIVHLFTIAYELREAETPGTQAYEFYDMIFVLLIEWRMFSYLHGGNRPLATLY